MTGLTGRPGLTFGEPGSGAEPAPAADNSMTGGAVLEVTEVTKAYRGSPGVVALAGVSLRIGPAERVAVTGPSGSGKSTLLHVLGTLERPDSGVVTVAGRDTSGLSDAEVSAVRGQALGFVFQRFCLLDHLDAVGNVALGLLYQGTARRARREAAAAALERVGLGHRLGHRPGQLSGGECQRVAIARAVAGHPAVILADEPTGNLDSATGAAIIDLLAGLADDGTAVVVVTHDPRVAAAMTRQVEIRDGRIAAQSGMAPGLSATPSPAPAPPSPAVPPSIAEPAATGPAGGAA